LKLKIRKILKDWINQRSLCLIIMGVSPQTPGILRFMDKNMLVKGQSKKPCPMSSSPVSALRLLPSIALSSELAWAYYQNHPELQAIKH